MRKYVIAAALLATLSLPATAAANHPTQAFAEASLRGQTSAAYAPDKDVAAIVNWTQTVCWNDQHTAHVDIVSTYLVSSYFQFTHYRRVNWEFLRAGGATFRRWFDAWWVDTTYHDANESDPYCP